MFKKLYRLLNAFLAILLVGFLLLGAPTAAFAADDTSSPGLRAADRGDVMAKVDDDGVDEPPPDPFAPKSKDHSSEKVDDDGVDEPPPDPIVYGRGWWDSLRGLAITNLMSF